jgi:hypothetical protein
MLVMVVGQLVALLTRLLPLAGQQQHDCGGGACPLLALVPTRGRT